MRYTKLCSKQDYVSRMSRANPAELNVINYELFILAVDNALEDAEKGDEKTLLSDLESARRFLAELSASLDMSANIAENLADIYLFVNKIIIDCLRTHTADNLSTAKDMMSALLDAWKFAAETTSHDNKQTSGGMYTRYGEWEDISQSNKDYKI